MHIFEEDMYKYKIVISNNLIIFFEKLLAFSLKLYMMLGKNFAMFVKKLLKNGSNFVRFLLRIQAIL